MVSYLPLSLNLPLPYSLKIVAVRISKLFIAIVNDERMIALNRVCDSESDARMIIITVFRIAATFMEILMIGYENCMIIQSLETCSATLMIVFLKHQNFIFTCYTIMTALTLLQTLLGM